ncbi:hypothetical protein HMN09_01405900 [Mycena chlorophos]|uniref:Uncharacterized protein n=1 Tax=Mycena chlorophos TaxID=658473 RepID=A0A8H6VNZ3_MYCCL|nr:hypothetical protein HMN09_01405900 [Mycena chlorophos]
MHPVFPLELERHIFLIAAEQDRCTGAVLLRIAYRVRTWIEPCLYHSVDTAESDVYAAFLRAAADKPDILRVGVRQMMASSLGFDDSITTLYHAIALCESLERITIAESLTCTDLLPILARLPIRRLAVTIDLIIPGTRLSEAAQCLRYVTHLEFFGSIFGSAMDEPSQASEVIVALPSLTHLACAFPPRDPDAWLEKLPRLRVFLIAPLTWPPDSLLEARYRDQRIVVTYWERWDECASYDEGYWDRAERFFEKKRRGEVPENEFRAIYDGPALPPLDSDADDD